MLELKVQAPVTHNCVTGSTLIAEHAHWGALAQPRCWAWPRELKESQFHLASIGDSLGQIFTGSRKGGNQPSSGSKSFHAQSVGQNRVIYRLFKGKGMMLLLYVLVTVHIFWKAFWDGMRWNESGNPTT